MSGTSLHHVLAAASAVFGRPISADDDFFALGGDSVVAIELATELENSFGREVDPELVMSTSPLGALAHALAVTTVSR